jgi:hypothetical protein
MRIGGDHLGPRGAALLAVAAVVGIVLAVHGWSVRHDGVPSSLAAPSSATPTATRSGGSTPPAPNRSSAPGPSRPSLSAGPKLNSQSYASYAFLVWPGTPSAAALAAKTGLVIKVNNQGSGISVAAGVAGQPLPAATFFPGGARVYVIEASMGDDSGSTDFNLGDDGLVVTDSHGRILR